MAINVADIDAELKRREAMSSGGGASSSTPSVEDIDAELVRRGATPPTSALGQVGDYLKNKAVDFATDVASPQGVGQKIGQNLPLIGAVAGGAMLPGAGAPLGAGVGQIAKRMIGIGTGAEPPSQGPVKEAVAPMVQSALVGIPETDAVKGAVQSTAQNLGRRALGFTKGMLKRMPGGIPQANEVAQTMLDKGVIQPLSGTEGTLERAKDLADTSGKAVGSSLAKTGQSALNTTSVANEVINQLAPSFKGGAYDAQEKAANEVVDTIMAHGNGPIDFQSGQQLKNKLGDLAKFNSSTDGMKAQMYRRAYGIVSDALEKGVASADSTGLPDYLDAKKTYGASQRAIQGLTDKSAGEASNSVLSLRGAAIGAGALASGHITPALEALGAWETARRYGAGFGAATLNSVNNSPAVDAVRRAALAKFIDKVTTK